MTKFGKDSDTAAREAAFVKQVSRAFRRMRVCDGRIQPFLASHPEEKQAFLVGCATLLRLLAGPIPRGARARRRRYALLGEAKLTIDVLLERSTSAGGLQ